MVGIATSNSLIKTPDIFIEYSNFNNFEYLVSLIRTHSLFESAGEIKFTLNDIERGFLTCSDISITVAFFECIPIACSIKLRHKIMCYVKPDFRRKKIGSLLASTLKNQHSYATIGFSNSDLFWNSLEIPII